MAPSPVHSVVFDWQTVYARQYEIQVSDDGQVWETVASRSGQEGRQEVVLDDTDPVLRQDAGPGGLPVGVLLVLV